MATKKKYTLIDKQGFVLYWRAGGTKEECDNFIRNYQRIFLLDISIHNYKDRLIDKGTGETDTLFEVDMLDWEVWKSLGDNIQGPKLLEVIFKTDGLYVDTYEDWLDDDISHLLDDLAESMGLRKENDEKLFYDKIQNKWRCASEFMSEEDFESQTITKLQDIAKTL